jgi:hypothetical protein
MEKTLFLPREASSSSSRSFSWASISMVGDFRSFAETETPRRLSVLLPRQSCGFVRISLEPETESLYVQFATERSRSSP